MSQPRVTVTFGRGKSGQVQRRATVYRDMYSDQINGAAGTNRKRSVRDRLGNSSDQQISATRPQTNSKRQRLEEGGKWKHDLYEEKEVVGIRQPNGQDLRSRLGPRNGRRGGQQQGEAGSAGGIMDLREKLSGSVPPAQLNRDIANQRRLASVVRGSAGIASLANVRPGASRNPSLSQKTPILHKPSVMPKPQPVESIGGDRAERYSKMEKLGGIDSVFHRTDPTLPLDLAVAQYVKRIHYSWKDETGKALPLMGRLVLKHLTLDVDENTIAGLLQSLGLSKYLITFQAEEVDMAALQHMGDDDLKELGVPMGPRKKILLAVGGRS